MTSLAFAAILLTSNPGDLVQSIADQPALVTGAAFTAIPPAGTPHGIGSSPLAGFPLSGGTFAILTTGNAVHADEPNTASDTSASDGGPSVRGDTDHDVSILRIDLNVPDDANCLSIGFRFLSEEYPEFVGSFFNDAFIAELDNSTWTTSGTAISAPDNFAFDPAHNVISVNAVGPTNMTGPNAVGTTYDGATPLLSASTPVTPGPHSLFLSIFDQGDDIFDSAVFLDRLVIARIPPEGCVRGATVLSASKTTSTPLVAPGGTVLYTITIDNSGDAPETLNAIADTLPAGFSYVPGTSSVLTTADPTVSGQDLTWNGPFSLAAHGSGVITFSATASATPGDYLNNAGATAQGLPVTPTGPTAKVTVSPCVTSQDGVPCNDGNACTSPDTCSGGACVGGPNVCACQSNADCGDDNPCTDDTCENPGTATAACAHVNYTAPCGDGNACTGPDTCSGGSCVGGPNVCGCQSNADCGDDNPCTDDVCENLGTPTATCVHVNNTAPCNDGNACTSNDACQGGVCTGSNPVVCTPSDQCHVTGTCNPATGACSNPPAQDGTACNDPDVCTIHDTCQAGTCRGGAHDDENPACNRPPECDVAHSTSIELWPPNHKFVTVSIAGLTDPDGDSLNTRIVGISQDEPLRGNGDGNTCPDGKGVGTGSASVRAERSGTGDGRVYRIAFTASDGKGGQCAGSVRICVPHDQRPGHVCGDDGPVIDSTGPCASR
ncbi:MAG TPA: choice-of-anchor L domain-containing protein [Candidatus Polarisedimenticolia bacterium]|nr:choice-of-anchor L domain-containing protein [Candidatus Polarisedimenticolia bacterium]